jgi:hypothetical protein
LAGSVLIEVNKEKELKHSEMYVFNECNPESIKPVIAGAAISGLFVIFQADEFFRIKKGILWSTRYPSFSILPSGNSWAVTYRYTLRMFKGTPKHMRYISHQDDSILSTCISIEVTTHN